MLVKEQRCKKRVRKMPAPGLDPRCASGKQILAPDCNNLIRGVKPPQRLDPPDHTEPRREQHAFPICPLHMTAVAFDFPSECAWGSQDPMTALGKLRDEAWSATSRTANGGDPSDGVLLHRIYNTCSRCPIRSHRHFRWLHRRRYGKQAG